MTFLLVAVVQPVLALTEGEDPNDDFNDNSIDSNKWFVFVNADGSVVETNQELQMELTSANTGSTFSVGVTSNWTIGGDFDIQVDYRLIIWPAENGIKIGLYAGPATTRGVPDVVERVSLLPEEGGGEAYLADFSYGTHVTPTNHTSGKLRLTRSGSTMTGYYFEGSEWVEIHSAPTSIGNGTVTLIIGGQWSTPSVFIAFDNFVVNYGQIWPFTMEEEVYTPSEIDPYFKMHMLYVSVPYIGNIRQMLRTMAQNLAGLGIEVHLNFVLGEEMLARIHSGKLFADGGYDATFFALATYPEERQNVSTIAKLMRDIFHSSNIPDPNVYMWNNTESDALLDTAVSSTDPSLTEQLLDEWQALYYEEQPTAVVYFRSDPDWGSLSVFGHVAFNMLHPVLGTGVHTPLGQSNLTRAAEAARYVRQAISHTIDRQWVVDRLPPELQPGQQGITPITPAMPGYDPSLQPYALNLTEARRLLSLAGYGMTMSGSSPISLWLTDSLGRHVGVDPQTGNTIVEIPWAYYSGSGTKPQIIYIPWPQGQYTIQVTGTETGSFKLSVTQVTQQTFTGVVTTGVTYAYTSSVTATGAETTTPGPSTELQNTKPYIKALQNDAFVNNPDQLKNALTHKIDEAILKTQAGSFEEAINKLENDIYPKVTGVKYDFYASGGAKAWITDAQIQETLQTYLQQIIREIQNMQSP